MASFGGSACEMISDACLSDWVLIGSGGFGRVYKARHCVWYCDVAIKLLHYDDGSRRAGASLLQEVKMMSRGSSPHVIHVLGLFNGKLPNSGPSIRLGLVMELMERGSLASLQKTLGGAPPWALVFRLAHQIALGINFLHSLSPALLHLDLKPDNVLLDPSLNAKLTDFGLARFYSSTTRVSDKDSEAKEGTYNYMPPEAFSSSYKPTRGSDIYSYGILLWSIVTGNKPYENAGPTIVKLRIPLGDRPLLNDITTHCKGITGLSRLKDLMIRCWDGKPSKRPCSRKCTAETEELYKMHRHRINDAVYEVQKKLDEKEELDQTSAAQLKSAHITQESDAWLLQEPGLGPRTGLRADIHLPTADTRPAHQATPLFYPTTRKRAGEDEEMQDGQTVLQTPAAGSAARTHDKARVRSANITYVLTVTSPIQEMHGRRTAKKTNQRYCTGEPSLQPDWCPYCHACCPIGRRLTH